MLGELQQLLTLGATGAGIYVALNGLRSWKRELTGKRDIDLCQNVIESFYEAEQKILELRSPMSYPTVESKDRPTKGPEADAEKKLRDTHYVPLARIQAQRDFWTGFMARKFRMRALFGQPAVKAFDDINKILSSFYAAATTQYRCIQGDQLNLNANTRERFEKILWALDDDQITRDVQSAIKQMEDICVPVVRANSSYRDHLAKWRKPKPVAAPEPAQPS